MRIRVPDCTDVLGRRWWWVPQSNSTAENAVLRLPRPFAPEKVLELFYGTGWRVPSSKHAGGTSASKVKQLAAELTLGAEQLAAALSQGVALPSRVSL